jgi:aldehyde oxidoreductase
VGDEDPAKVEELIDGSKYVVEGSFYSTPQPHLTIEGETLQATGTRTTA